MEVVSDKVSCFKGAALVYYMKRHGTRWCMVVACARMSNGRSERMVHTLKPGIEKLSVMARIGLKPSISAISDIFGSQGRLRLPHLSFYIELNLFFKGTLLSVRKRAEY